MPWPSGGKRGARLARHGMSSSHVLATIFASWPLTPRIAMVGFTVLIRRRKVHDRMAWESTTLGRRSPFLCTQRSALSRQCQALAVLQARNKLPPRPLSACGNPASRYLVLSESVFVFLCFLCFFFEGRP
ncbi:hypothetical protein V8E52_009266 [Russula decolorans]